ncbi:hypothetical protein ACFYP4_03425 [Streptomyces sp. NPDC005551]|uniref:hypothetical protein n=1 Tax=Streptomyces sp. NPDC005551 TaxID=3364725 RepID=UPI0036B4A4E4
MTTNTRVEVCVRRLVWDGAGPPSPVALCAAVEAELAVLLGNSLTVGDLDPALPADSALAAHARRIARAIQEVLRAGQPPDPHHRFPHVDRPLAPDVAPTPTPKAGAPTP